MSLSIMRLLFDFGLLVLIWMVQLIIYPSFQFYVKNDLLKWHEKYTVAISFIVIPLMFGQLITAVLELLNQRDVFTIGSLVLIILVWISTFTQFVPMHGTIASGLANQKLLKELVFKNWLRTALWSLIFIWSFLKTFQKLVS